MNYGLCGKYLTVTYISERSAHDNGFVAMLLVVVEDFLHGLDTRIFVTLVRLSSSFLVPIKDLGARVRQGEVN